VFGVWVQTTVDRDDIRSSQEVFESLAIRHFVFVSVSGKQAAAVVVLHLHVEQRCFPCIMLGSVNKI